MELWIRSQNKGALVRVEILGNTDGIIKAYSGNNKILLGKYNSSGRALEVLDEIQNIIHLKDMYVNDRKEVLKAWTKLTEEQIENIRTKMSVYEMPKE